MQECYFNNARISQLHDGKLAVICDRVTNTGNGHDSQIYLWFSEDEGVNWSEPTILPFSGIVPDRLRQLQNGRLLICAHNLNPDTDKLEEYLWYSDNNGQTWSSRITLAADPRYNLCEVCIVECEDGTLAAFLRENSFEGYDIMKVISYNAGESWSEVYRTT
jgi:sialidase-1